MQIDEALNSEDEDTVENENNNSEPGEHRTSNECLIMIEKIRYLFLCSDDNGLNCPNTTLFREIQTIEDSIHIIKANNMHQICLEHYFNMNSHYYEHIGEVPWGLTICHPDCNYY